jgi:hypothetical protein
MRSQEIDYQDGPYQMTPGENRNPKTVSLRRPPNEETLEVALLCFVNSKVNLCDRSGENEQNGRCQTGKGQCK